MTALASFEKDALVYRAIHKAAEAGRRCPTFDELADVLDQDGDGGPGQSSTVLVIQRLERNGHIRVRRYQRHREVEIVATGKWTAAAPCRTPHWRDRCHG